MRNGRVQPGDTVVVVGARPIGSPRSPQPACSNPPGSLTTDGQAAYVAIEAVGIPESFELCTRLVRPGGHVANVGVHGKPATLHLEDLWIRNLTITTGLVDTTSTPLLLDLLTERRLNVDGMITHRFGLEEMLTT
ncbi:zinc-binding dehydrogenase (plasmid) [Embleya sp. NBC_00896]|nr:zinc-binding dehydrogenase [Embleya sp. NBC_00896]